MKIKFIWEILLICILIITGWYLYGIMKQVESNNPELKAIENDNNLIFSDGAGIDFMGNKIDSFLENKADEDERFVVAFLLRYNSLDADLKFWNEVKGYLSEPDTIRLTAYCENNKCVEAIRINPDKVHFPVLEYGEASDMQAVIAADANGEFYLQGSRFRKIKWRNEILEPFDIAMSIGLGR